MSEGSFSSEIIRALFLIEGIEVPQRNLVTCQAHIAANGSCKGCANLLPCSMHLSALSILVLGCGLNKQAYLVENFQSIIETLAKFENEEEVKQFTIDKLRLLQGVTNG